MTPVDQLVLSEIPLSKLDPSPWNPRRHIERDPHLQGLAESIEASGLATPILVRPLGKRWQIVYGHRRTAASKLAGLKKVPAIVRELTDDQAKELTIVENLQREDLHPLEEAFGVKALYDRDKQTIESVADKLGKSPDWVAKRLRLCGLSAKWQQLIDEDNPDSPFPEWPSTWLEDVAVLNSESQDLLLKQRGWLERVTTRAELRRVRDDYLHVLSGAGWKLDDAELLPQAGPCSECPERSSQQQLLFVDLPDAKADKHDICLNRACWERKKAAFVKLQERKLAAEVGPVIKISTDWQKRNKDKSLVSEYDIRTCGKTAKGARKALFVDGPQAGKIVHVMPPAKQSAAGSGQSAGKKTLKEKRKLLDKRRKRKAIEQLIEDVQGSLLPPDREELCWLVCCFGVQDPAYHVNPLVEFERKIGWLDNSDPEDPDGDLWRLLKPVLTDWLRDDYRDIDETWKGAGVMASLLPSTNLGELFEEACKEIAEPKAWAAEESAAGSGQSAGKKAKV